MADIVISYAGDGERVAGQLAGALAHRGYRIWSEAEAGGPIAERVAQARAAVILWSPAARASDWVRAEANFARGQSKLVQASIDEAPPPMPFDAAAAAPLAGWNGEPDHPGWKRIEAEVAALCGPGAAAATPRAPPAPRTAPIPRPAAPVAARGGGGRGLIGVMGVLFLLLAGVGTFLWMRSGPPYSKVEPPPPAASRPAATTVPRAPAALPPPPPPVEPMPAEEPMAEPPAPEPEPPAPQSRPEPRPTGPRINRRNSENMRLFCERAGRGTPQCRDFQRRLRQGR